MWNLGRIPPQSSSFWGEKIGKIYSTWIFGYSEIHLYFPHRYGGGKVEWPKKIMVTLLEPIQWIILAVPPALILSAYIVFRFASRRLGREKGYLLGFGFYWFGWCLLFPRLLLGKTGFGHLITDGAPLFSIRNWPAALLWVIITGVTLVMYGRKFLAAEPVLIFLAVLPAVINGFCEEMLWRGVYVQVFQGNFWLGVLFPAVGFSLWHIVPQSIFPAENEPAFILSTFFLGLAYGFIAWRTGSALWTAVSHSLGGILALSGIFAPNFLKLLRRQNE